MSPAIDAFAHNMILVARETVDLPIGTSLVTVGAPCPDGCGAACGVSRRRALGFAEVYYDCGVCGRERTAIIEILSEG